jgi:toxin-antitoxin system PIN domain toxin
VILADVNVLIYAFRRDSERHVFCKRGLDNVVQSDAQFGLSPLVQSGLARIVTNQRIFLEPSPIEEVFTFCDSLLSQPHCEIVRPGPRHSTIFRRICVEAGARGPLVADAWFAALAIEHGCAWIRACGHALVMIAITRDFRDWIGGSRISDRLPVRDRTSAGTKRTNQLRL